MAWFSFNATETKPWNVVCYFTEKRVKKIKKSVKKRKINKYYAMCSYVEYGRRIIFVIFGLKFSS